MLSQTLTKVVRWIPPLLRTDFLAIHGEGFYFGRGWVGVREGRKGSWGLFCHGDSLNFLFKH